MDDYHEHLNQEQLRYQSSAELAEGHANETSRLLSTQLNAVAAALIGLSAASISNEALLKQLSRVCANTIFISWGLLGISLLLGITQIIMDYYFFVGWRDRAIDITRKISSREINTPEALETSVHKAWSQKGAKSNQIALWLQVAALTSGVILLLVALGLTLQKAAH